MPDQIIDPERLSYSNANQTNGAIIHNNTIWTAAEGGIVAWNKENRSFVKFTSSEGLAHNQFDTVVDCPLPGLGIVFGSVQGLQMFDTRNGNWNTLNSQNSAMSFDDVSTVVCDADNNYVIIGYRQHGMDIYDTAANTWTHIDKSGGLENNFVDTIAVLGDREEIWVASGFGITVLTDDESVTYDASGGPLTTNQVNAMRAGPDGTMWIVTPDALFAVRNGRWSEYSTATISAPEFPTGVLVGLDIAADGSIWLVSDRAEVCRFDWLLRRCREFYSDEEGMAPGPVTNLNAGEEDYLIYTTRDAGISVYDGEDWRQLALPAEPLAGNSVRSLAQDSEGFIWVVTDGGVSQIHPTEQAVHRTYKPGVDGFPALDVQTLSPAIDGGMWFGGLGAGSLTDGVWTAYNAVDGLAGNVVQVIESDAQNRTWIGTKSGLSIWNGSDFFNLTEENGLPSANISALLPDGERMWIGTDGGGLFRFERSQLRVYNALNAALPGNTINALAMASDGTLWVGGDRGLARFDGTEAESVEELSRVEVTAIVVGDDETVWVGTAGQGIFVYDGDEWSQLTEKDGLPSLDISALLVDNYGSVWVGGERGGLIRIAAQ
jgi:ligand-binding sensor domain-containing protein